MGLVSVMATLLVKGSLRTDGIWRLQERMDTGLTLWRTKWIGCTRKRQWLICQLQLTQLQLDKSWRRGDRRVHILE